MHGKMKEIPPLSCRITVLKVEKRTLKREARVSFHSESGGVTMDTIVRVGDFHRAHQPLSQEIVVL